MDDLTPSARADIIYRKIGRNVVGFQKLEGMLKDLSRVGSYRGSLDEIQRQHSKHRKSLHKKSFGQVVSLFFDVVYDGGKQKRSRGDSNAFEFSLTIQGGGREELKSMLQTLVDERNELIHTRLLEFDCNSDLGCKELESFLDAQNERVRPTLDKVTYLLEGMRRLRSRIAEIRPDDLRIQDDDDDEDEDA